MKQNYERELYLTFDIDWALDEVTDYVFNILADFGVTATFFMTHPTNRAHDYAHKIELGIHPNFLPAFAGTTIDERFVYSTIAQLKQLYPSSVSLRSHSLVQGGFLTQPLIDNGIRYEVNTLIPYPSPSVLYPYSLGQIVRVPFLFEDDVFLGQQHGCDAENWSITDILDRQGIKVISFHPIHVYMNAKDLDHYRRIKPCYHDLDKIRCFKRNIDVPGVGNLLIELIQEGLKRGFSFRQICEVDTSNG